MTVILLFIFFTVFSAGMPAAHSETLTGSGCSVSNMGYLTELAEDYEKLTGVKMFVRSGGSVVGIEDLRSGKVDFAASCRHRMDADPGDIDFIQVAWDALVFIVHKSNPVDNISLEEVRGIYEGRITNWGQLKGRDLPVMVFISRPQKGHGLSGVETSTKEMILKGKEPVKTQNATFLASTGIVDQMVEKTAGGFATSGFSSAIKRDVKILKVNGVYPDKGKISEHKYPLKRPLFLLLPKNPKPEARKFLDFALSRKGQELISSYGAISLSDVR